MSMTRHTCTNCVHYGQCADLHYCGGMSWEPDEPEEDEEDDDDGGYTPDPYDGPDPYEQWEHDAEVWQESADRRW